MRLLYLSTWDFSNEEADGVCKKIKSHIKSFEDKHIQVDYVYIRDNMVYFREDGQDRCLFRVGSVKKTVAYIGLYRYLKYKRYDWVYNRYGVMDSFYYRVLKRLYKNGAKILIEIPTYPYIDEQPKTLLYRIMYLWERVYLGKLKKIVERIVTYSLEEEIWEIRTIRTMNGIDVSNADFTRCQKIENDTVDLLVVALMQVYHGYERLLYGLKTYYQKGGNRKVVCHMVGGGPEKNTYEKIVKENNLDKYVIFYGMKSGKELDEIYKVADIGVCALGGYKTGLYRSSELKTREYLIKGVPILTGMELDVFEVINKQYFLQFPNDETEIDIEKVVEFYDKFYTGEIEKTRYDMHNMAVQKLSAEATMSPVIEYMMAN